MTMGALMAVRRFQLKVFDGSYEVLTKQRHTVDLDLQSAMVPGVLSERLVALTRQAAAVDNETMDSPRLELWDGNTKVMDWAG